MTSRFRLIFATACGLSALPFAASANPTPEEVSATVVFALDTFASSRHVKTAEDLAALWPVTRRAGESVVLVSSSGASTTLIPADSEATSASLVFSEGGAWTASNSVQGTAVFFVRHSLYGTLGDGTLQSPAKLVDGDELIDYNAGDGYVFTLNGGESHFGDLKLPTGFRLEYADRDAEPQKWRIAADASGLEYVGPELVAPLDTYYVGSARRLHVKGMTPVAYTGDHWCRNASADSTLTFFAPNGQSTAFDLSGTGVQPFKFNQTGIWTVRLAMADETTLEAEIVASAGFAIFVR